MIDGELAVIGSVVESHSLPEQSLRSMYKVPRQKRGSPSLAVQ